jgi:hypothetical protein
VWRLHDHQLCRFRFYLELDVGMMDIMTMMEMWFALVARAPARVDRINLERPGTVWPAGPGLTTGQLSIALGSRSVHDFDAIFIYKGQFAYIRASISLLAVVSSDLTQRQEDSNTSMRTPCQLSNTRTRLLGTVNARVVHEKRHLSRSG